MLVPRLGWLQPSQHVRYRLYITVNCISVCKLSCFCVHNMVPRQRNSLFSNLNLEKIFANIRLLPSGHKRCRQARVFVENVVINSRN